MPAPPYHPHYDLHPFQGFIESMGEVVAIPRIRKCGGTHNGCTICAFDFNHRSLALANLLRRIYG